MNFNDKKNNQIPKSEILTHKILIENVATRRQ